MDKKENRDKRKKNLSYKTSKHKEDKKTEKDISTVSEDILPNNWSKYEINEHDDVQEGADFETLLHEPISNGSHFKFKSEQNWDANISSELELNKYFTLDMKLLGEGISTIPFPKRHNYNENLFTCKDLESIRKNSEINTQKYKKILEKKVPGKSNIIVIRKNIDEILPQQSLKSTTETETELPDKTKESEIIIERKTECNDTILHESEKDNVSDVIEIKAEPKGQRVRRKKEQDEVDELLNLTSAPESNADKLEIKAEDPLLEPTDFHKMKMPTTPQNSTIDLEQWLDDILDD